MLAVLKCPPPTPATPQSMTNHSKIELKLPIITQTLNAEAESFKPAAPTEECADLMNLDEEDSESTSYPPPEQKSQLLAKNVIESSIMDAIMDAQLSTDKTKKKKKKKVKFTEPNDPDQPALPNEEPSVLWVRPDQKWWVGKATETPLEKRATSIVKMTNTRGEIPVLIVKSQQTIREKINLLVDTGSNRTLIKHTSLKPEVPVNTKDITNLKGIGGRHTTVGSCYLYVKIGTRHNCIKFDVIDEDPIGEGIDGILGTDIIDERCVIDMVNRTISFTDEAIIERPRPQDLFIDESVFQPITAMVRVVPDTESECEPAEEDGSEQEGQEEEEDEETRQARVDLCSPTKLALREHDALDLDTMSNRTPDPENRVPRIMKAVKTDHLTAEQRKVFEEFAAEFSQVFKLDGDPLEKTNALELQIPLTSPDPIYVKQYRLAKHHLKAAIETVNEWERAGIVEPTISAFNSPLVVVEKGLRNPDNSIRYRICCDLRGINKRLVKSYYNLPKIQDIVDEIPKTRFYSCLDLSDGYLAIGVREQDRQILAFTVGNRRFHFLRMPFGLQNAGFAFTKLMEKVLRKLLTTGRVFSYLDDALACANSFEEMMELLGKIFREFRAANLHVNPLKLEIFKEKVIFLGFQISEAGIAPNPKKVAAINRIQEPSNKKEVLSFIAATNFFKNNIKRHSELCEPLLKLVRKDAKFVWSEKCKTNFQALKDALMKPPVLAHASELEEPGAIAVVMCDASRVSIGACLAVYKHPATSLKPISYMSKVLNKHERNYAIYDLEFLALVFAVTYFKHHLIGPKQFFCITDHKPLLALHSAGLEQFEGRILRWKLKLDQFNFKLLFLNGNANCIADLLSRLPDEPDDEASATDLVGDIPSYVVQTRATRKSKKKRDDEEQEDTETAYNPSQVVDEQPKEQPEQIQTTTSDLEDAFKTIAEINAEQETQDATATSEDDEPPEEIKLPAAKLVTDKKEQQELIKLYHSHKLVGHLGCSRSILRIREHFYWRGMNKQMSDYVKSCPVCAKAKNRNNTRKVPRGVGEVPHEPWSTIYYDLVGPLPPSGEFRYILTLQDSTTRFAVFRCLTSKLSDEIAATLFDVFLQFGGPRTLVSDLAPELNSATMRSLMKLIDVNTKNCTVYHPASNISERLNASLKDYLRCYLTNDRTKANWSFFVPLAQFAFNMCPSSSSGFAPYTLLFGRLGKDLINLKLDPVYTYNDMYDEIRAKIRTFNEIAREKALAARMKDKLKADKHSKAKTFIPGEKIYFKKFVKGSLDDRLETGTVVEDIDEQNVKVTRKNKAQILHKDNVYKSFQ